MDSNGLIEKSEGSRIMRKDYSGQKFGIVTVLNELKVKTKNNKKHILWKCLCDCGKEAWFDRAKFQMSETDFKTWILKAADYLRKQSNEN